jgi:hypothetical protein
VNGLKIDDEDRLKIAKAISTGAQRATLTLNRRAKGDYSLDSPFPVATRANDLLRREQKICRYAGNGLDAERLEFAHDGLWQARKMEGPVGRLLRRASVPKLTTVRLSIEQIQLVIWRRIVVVVVNVLKGAEKLDFLERVDG